MRLDDIAFLDDATRPEAPKFDNLTLQQRAPGRHLRMIHNHFRENMALLRDLIEKAASGELTPSELEAEANALPLMENYRQFGALCGQHCQIIQTHHAIEDQAIFPRLSPKSAVFRKVTARLVAEHEVIHDLLVHLIDALGALIEHPGASAFADVRHVYEALEKALLSHFDYEEDSIGDALGYFEIGI